MEDLPKPFLDHLEELRRRLIKSIAAVAAGTVLAYQSVDSLLVILAKPVGTFVFLEPTEALFVRLKVALVGGVLLALPLVSLQLWKFVSVAIRPEEKLSFYWIFPVSYLLFLLGFAFGFFVLVPKGIQFLLSYRSDVLVPTLSIEHYINFVGVVCLVLGAVFEMPLGAYIAAKLGALKPEALSGKRRIAVLVSYVAGAFLTPGPDPVTATMLAVPIYVLYECSILAAKWGAKKAQTPIVAADRI